MASRKVLLCLSLGLLSVSSSRVSAGYDAFRPTPPLVADRAGQTTDLGTPAVHARRLEGSTVRVDGKLDEDVWNDAAAGQHFSVWEPDRGKQPTEQTVFKVAYDDEAIYFAVACWERDPRNVSALLSRRDRFSDSDLVSVYIDPYDDNTTGYNFRVNPLGVQSDAYIYNDGERDDDWDAVWQSEVSRDKDGWYAEIKVPFSSIRYREADRMNWGLQVYRYMHGRGEDTAWVSWDREQSGFVSRFGVLDGLERIPAPRQLEVLPYTVARTTDPAISGPEDRRNFENFGADIKYGITSDLTLNATVQPDFGQVEADPAQLNLSPFETFFSEKRPFFVEGNRFFEMPGFDLFYSRRIGTGDENSRIRFAGKVSGKVEGDVSVAALAAVTDVTSDGQAHNFLKSGELLNRYFVTRIGKQWRSGTVRANLMQTAVQKSAKRSEAGNFLSRDAFTTGVDIGADLFDRAYGVTAYSVGSIIAPEKLADTPGSDRKKYGTGGGLSLSKNAGRFRGSVSGRWESDRLDLNDLGFLSAPDEASTSGWMQYRYTPEGESGLFNSGSFNLNLFRSWLYSGRSGFDAHTGARAWSYGPGHPQTGSGNVNANLEFRGFQQLWGGFGYNEWGTQRYETRGGPLMGEPTTWGGWLGGSTDSRKNLVYQLEGNHWVDSAQNASTDLWTSVAWNQNSAINHELSVSYGHRVDDTQYLDQVEAEPGAGIGGISYLFGDIVQETMNITLRTNVLFDRNKSLELYLQPFQTVGRYSRVRELERADSYSFSDYPARAADYDFNYAALNLNMVYRWEYRPGSTFFLVWTQGRQRYDQRNLIGNPARYQSGLDSSQPFDSEPENVLLAKISYWLPI